MTAHPSLTAAADQGSAGAACDVIVVGAGAAGLAAAVAAAEAGAAVTLIEKLPGLRGTTSWSVGSVAAAGTRLQQAAGIADDPAAFAEDILPRARFLDVGGLGANALPDLRHWQRGRISPSSVLHPAYHCSLGAPGSDLRRGHSGKCADQSSV